MEAKVNLALAHPATDCLPLSVLSSSSAELFQQLQHKTDDVSDVLGYEIPEGSAELRIQLSRFLSHYLPGYDVSGNDEVRTLLI